MPISHETLVRYQNPVFVETGSFMGDGINNALVCGFNKIISIEIHEPYFRNCSSRYKNIDRVSLYLGDSGVILYNIIKDIDEDITFWLDGHISTPEVAQGIKFNPIEEELEQIKRHHRKNHTILIDDRRLFNTNDFERLSENDLRNKILSINPHYKFFYLDGHIKDDILGAIV